MNGATARAWRSPARVSGRPASCSATRAGAAVDLPHDWAVELPFDPRADAGHGFKALGSAFPGNSVAWYRRTFTLPAADAGRRLWLEFDGVYRDATVFVNGWFVGHHESGYSGFRYDITDVAEPGGRNVVAVRVDATESEGWFYEGAGIYRHTWLVETGPLAVAPDGVFVRGAFKNNSPGGPAKVQIETRLANAAAAPAAAEIVWTILGPDGHQTIATIRRPARVAGAVNRRRGRLRQRRRPRALVARNARASISSSPPSRSPVGSSTASPPRSACARSPSTPNGAFC